MGHAATAACLPTRPPACGKESQLWHFPSPSGRLEPLELQGKGAERPLLGLGGTGKWQRQRHWRALRCFALQGGLAMHACLDLSSTLTT